MTTKKLTKLLALYLPYILLGLVATNFGEAWRLAEGKELGDKIMSMVGTLPLAFANPLPSLHPLDLLIGFFCGAGLRLAVYLRSKNAKKYRHGMEYGSARWGTPKDIEPFQAPKFADNIILTKTERLMMSNRPPDPKNARNKNVLVVGGSGSGKTRFWLKPNLLQCHSSYVVTDPKGTIVLECGQAMLKNGYKVKILNTINFKKSMHYNPFSYVHSEKDILKLVTTLMTNTKGEGSGGDPFWEKSERLLLTALIAYLHYEAPVEEQNFATLLEMLNTMQVLEDDEEYQNPVDLLFEDFLGWNFRKYNEKLIIKPSQKAVKAIVSNISDTILRRGKAWQQDVLIMKLNEQIRGWTNYHQSVCASDAFAHLDYVLYELLWRWAKRRHPKKNKWWISTRYWHRVGNRNWVFSTENKELIRVDSTAIVRHTKIKASANPFLDEAYFQKRKFDKGMHRLTGKFKTIWKNQNGLCYHCGMPMDVTEEREIFYLAPKAKTGTEDVRNMRYVHCSCQRIYAENRLKK